MGMLAPHAVFDIIRSCVRANLPDVFLGSWWICVVGSVLWAWDLCLGWSSGQTGYASELQHEPALTPLPVRREKQKEVRTKESETDKCPNNV